jgi:hypothetical protein
MLCRNVSQRATAHELLHSQWVQNCKVENSIDCRILKNLEKFYVIAELIKFRDRFKAVVLTYLASNTISK